MLTFSAVTRPGYSAKSLQRFASFQQSKIELEVAVEVRDFSVPAVPRYLSALVSPHRTSRNMLPDAQLAMRRQRYLYRVLFPISGAQKNSLRSVTSSFSSQYFVTGLCSHQQATSDYRNGLDVAEAHWRKPPPAEQR